KSLAGLARRDFEKFVKEIYRGGAGLAASTVNDRMVMVAAIMEAAVVDKRITENPARGIWVSRRDALAVDEDEVPTSAEVDLIAAYIAPRFRLTVYLQSGTGQRPSESLAFSTECRRPGYVRIIWQVSAKAHREDCPRPFVFKKACLSAGLVDLDGNAKYTPRSLQHFYASTALANDVPIHEVSRWLGHRSVKTTVGIYGHLLPSAWDRCREVLQRAMRPAPLDATSLPAEEAGWSADARAV
ncbi:tyrosine-type recombinase/integrase, partial [Micrococcus luteus]|uniref:tyrosine-type recombinase/integrase n=2 Tax=Actinomycetes TaxID=1760 RepID=UPI00366BCE89